MWDLQTFVNRLFGTANTRVLKNFHSIVDKITAAEPEVVALTDQELNIRTNWFKHRLNQGETLDDILVEAFATVREAAKRTLGERHFDVQLIGGIILHQGKIAEMKTGEGKTLVSTLAVYLNALQGKGVHVVTVNDYLARRDSEWMGQIYEYLDLSVGCIVHGLSDAQRRDAYQKDVTYGTNNEFGFDYLRDNMKFRVEDMVQKPFNFAIVDEVDSILIDEARTPLIISGSSSDSSELYQTVNALITRLSNTDYEKDEKQRTVTLTETGTEKIEKWVYEEKVIKSESLYDVQNINIVHHINQALRAHQLFTRDKDYIVKDDHVVIIDEFTGRMMAGRRYGDGLHQAIEAKEYVSIQQENQTLASITFQNYFRLYPKLAGMTGTAVTEAAEFGDIYGLDVVEIPTHQPVVRIDHDDEIYRQAYEKNDAILDLIAQCRQRHQPVLVGTVSIEKSELLAKALKKRRIPHNVLNARYHEQEAQIIAQAGTPGTVTIATNMAGRGTDIQLGGNIEMRIFNECQRINDPQVVDHKKETIYQEGNQAKSLVKQAGGLYVIGTERHEARRIDNQLRGRSGRQGDPGESKFFLSLEDDLMRIFGSQRIDAMLKRLGLKEGEAIIHKWINQALERAQKKVEAHNFEIRKTLLKFDNVMNDQRSVIYEQRRDIMMAEDVSALTSDMRSTVIIGMVEKYIPAKTYPEQWDLNALQKEVKDILNLDLPITTWQTEDGVTEEEIEKRIKQAADSKLSNKAAIIGEDAMAMMEKKILLYLLDQNWKDHLYSLDHLRHGINLRAYGQRDPLNEYKREAFTMFEEMLDNLSETVTRYLMKLEIQVVNRTETELALEPRVVNVVESHADPALATAGVKDKVMAAGVSSEAAMPSPQMPRHMPIVTRVASHESKSNDPSTWGRISRNTLCPCGSGKKYKHCHGHL